ncbi:MAG: hypothetical protein M3305_16225 [Actinomycetota bacterium]|nr:hypothetical protein [Actinomycetota bacterium]
MRHILFRTVIFVVIMLLLSTGCSSLFGNPRAQANDHLKEANEAIEEHNQLFEEARSVYDNTKKSVEAGESTTLTEGTTSVEGTTEEGERFVQAQETMQEARDTLAEAREPLSDVQDLNVESEIQDYASSLSNAVDSRLAAEDREIEYYKILEQDPTLSENRQEALDLLAKAGDSYKESENAYARAQEIADANPDLLKKG